MCWGRNEVGQLGLGDQISRSAPTIVSALGTDVATLAICATQSFALLKDGTVKSWGYNHYGQLGLGFTTGWPNGLPTPTTVTALGTDVATLAIGYDHSCALLRDRTVKCWGRSFGGRPQQTTPTTVSELGTDVIALTSGYLFTCAVLTSNTSRCWGQNNAGQLGLGDTTARSNVPTVVALGTNVASFALGQQHACATLTNGSAVCWGQNVEGQLGLGRGDTMDRLEPTIVSALGTEVASLTLSDTHSCALLTDRHVRCWGQMDNGRLGTGDGTVPVAPLMDE